MHDSRASTGRRPDRQRQPQREPPRHVRTADAGAGYRPTRPPDGGYGDESYRHDGYRHYDHRYAEQPAPLRGAIWWPVVAAIALVVAANIIAITGTRFEPVSSVIGFWFILLYPVYLLYTTSFWARRPAAERVGYSVAAVLLLLILIGLAFNTLLPPLGVKRPLGHLPVAVLGDTIILSLVMVRRRYRGSFSWPSTVRLRMPAEARLIGGSLLCVALAVMGANRLNNDAGPLVSMVALAGIAVMVVLLLRMCRQLREGVIAASLYFVSLALLLLTSLRGWYISGHDIQVEYRAFQLVVAHGHWDYSLFPNAYNGCLSITILPAEIANVTNIDTAYVFKAIFPIVFAIVPVLVYTISRRYWPRRISILAATYFISLPNYFTDMTYEDRQEIAFVFACAGILAITNVSWSQPQRRLALLLAAVGLELSHYSTTYMFLGAITGAWVFGSLLRLFRRRGSFGEAYSLATPWTDKARTVGLGTIAVMFSITFLWGGLVTQTSQGALRTVASSVSQLFTPRAGSTPEYDLFSRAAAPSPGALLAGYRHDALAENELSKPGTYISPAIARGYPTPLVAQPPLPLTRLGRLLGRVGPSAQTVNTVVRGSAAKDEQLFLAVGLAAIGLTARLRRRVPREFFCLCAGSAFMVGLFVIFPNLSTDYGLLRAFQETLIVVAPVLVEGSLAIFMPFGYKWSLKLTSVVAVVVLVSTTGLMTQLLGGYPAQLSLNNSGDYYDEYYIHPQEVAADTWLEGKPGVLPDGLQAAVPSVFAFSSPSGVSGDQVVTNIYPELIQQSGWVLLNYATVHHDRAMINVGNDAISYHYPMGFLQSNKNLVYNNGGAQIYR